MTLCSGFRKVFSLCCFSVDLVGVIVFLSLSLFLSAQLGLHQGSQGLLQRVQPYHALAEGGVFELTQLGEEASPWTETVDSLTTAEHVKLIHCIVD